MTAYTLAITHPGGGVGKTTTALNLGWSLVLAGRRVLLVDIDPQGDLSRRLQQAPRAPTLAEALLARTGAPARAHCTWDERGLDLIPSDLETMAGLDVDLVGVQLREQRLRRALKAYLDDYDYILVDCPPNLTLLGINALYAAEGVLIPVQAQDKAVSQLATALTNLRDVQSFRADESPARAALPRLIGLVLTMVDKRTIQSRQAEADLRQEQGALVLPTTIPMRTALQNDSRYGAPIGVYDPDDDSAQAYRALAAEVLTRAR